MTLPISTAIPQYSSHINNNPLLPPLLSLSHHSRIFPPSTKKITRLDNLTPTMLPTNPRNHRVRMTKLDGRAGPTISPRIQSIGVIVFTISNTDDGVPFEIAD